MNIDITHKCGHACEWQGVPEVEAAQFEQWQKTQKCPRCKRYTRTIAPDYSPTVPPSIGTKPTVLKVR